MNVCVITNRVPVAKGYEDAFEERFRNRAGLLDNEPGFLRNEVLLPRPMKMDMAAGGLVPDDDKQGYFLIKIWWRDFDDFVACVWLLLRPWISPNWKTHFSIEEIEPIKPEKPAFPPGPNSDRLWPTQHRGRVQWFS